MKSKRKNSTIPIKEVWVKDDHIETLKIETLKIKMPDKVTKTFLNNVKMLTRILTGTDPDNNFRGTFDLWINIGINRIVTIIEAILDPHKNATEVSQKKMCKEGKEEPGVINMIKEVMIEGNMRAVVITEEIKKEQQIKWEIIVSALIGTKKLVKFRMVEIHRKEVKLIKFTYNSRQIKGINHIEGMEMNSRLKEQLPIVEKIRDR